MAFRDANGSVESSRWWRRSAGEFVGRPVAPFSGCDAGTRSVAALLGFLAASLGVLATLLGLLATLLGFLAALLGYLATSLGYLAALLGFLAA